MIDNIANLLKKFLTTKVYEIKVKDYMICNSIIWRLCNEDEAESLRNYYLHIMNGFIEEI